MGLFRKAVYIVILGVAARYLLSLLRDRAPPPTFGGRVDPGFEAVEKAFR